MKLNKRYFQVIFIAFLLVINQLASCQQKNNMLTFSELPKILNSQNHGEVLYIKNGVYEDINITLKNKKPVKIMAETAGHVILKGNTQIRLQSCDSLILSGFYFDSTFSKQLIKFNRVTNSIIENMLFKQNRGSSPYSRIIGIQDNSSNNIIRNNTFDGIQTMGVAIDDGNNTENIITKNVFKNIESVKSIYPDTNGNGMECIGVGRWDSKAESALRTEISYNYFENIKADGMEVVCVKSNWNKIKNNFFTKCLGGVSLRYGNNNLVMKNVFVNNGQNIRIFGDGHVIRENYMKKNNIGIQLPAANYKKEGKKMKTGYYQATNINISNNRFEEMKVPVLAIGEHQRKDRSLLPSDIVFENNIGVESKFLDEIEGKLKIRVHSVSSPKADAKFSHGIDREEYYFGKSW